MSDTRQPTWKCIGHIGDVDPIAYGGGFVYIDETGVYDPVLIYFEPASDEDWHKLGDKAQVSEYRIVLEKDSTREWWYKNLESIASYTGMPLEEVLIYANSNDPVVKAQLYADLISYHGVENFHSYPCVMTEEVAYDRYKEEFKVRR
jgi:hypothetical protein